MKKLLLTLMLFAVATFGFAQIAAIGDYRSIKTGNWSDPTTWQVRTGANTWLAATVAPTATNNTYLQNGFTVTVDDAVLNSCKDLQINTLAVLALAAKTLSVNGKIRAFTGTTAETSSGDGVLYSNPNPNPLTLPSTMITYSTLSLLKFVGGTRIVTDSGEWTNNGNSPYASFALDNLAIGTFNAGMKLRELTVESGIMDVANVTFSLGNVTATGKLTIQSGATFKSARSFTSNGSQVVTYNSTTQMGPVTINSGGVMELTGNNPVIDCTVFTNSGTVIYSGSNQNLLAKANGTDALTFYTNLKIASNGTATLPASSDITVSGTLTMTSGNLAIPATSTLALTNGNTAVVGGSSSSYVQTLADGVSAGGILKVSGLSTSKTFPVGSVSNYLPVSLTPAASSNFSINTFNGATTNATPTGVAIADKTSIVDAIYNINRTSGTGSCNVTLGWDASLEGSTFTGVADNQIGAAQYISGAYGSFTGVGNNSANTVSLAGVSTFAPFLVGKNAVLPVSLTSFTAQKQATGVTLKWNTASEQNNSHFDVQRSTDGITFSNIAKVNGAGNSSTSLGYYFTDKTPASGVNYYRLNQVDFNGTATLSKVVSANTGFSNSAMQVYAGANSSAINISISAEQASAGQLIVYNMGGQKVFEQALSVNKGNNDLSISMSNANKGVFVVSYDNGVQVLKKKFVK